MSTELKRFIVVHHIHWFNDKVTVESSGKIYCVVPSGDAKVAEYIADALNEWTARMANDRYCARHHAKSYTTLESTKSRNAAEPDL